jgi:3-oxoacyl-[acyl-carrier protein] reductase
VDLGLSGRRAAVAASSTGLGYAAAAALAAEGVHVAVCGRDKDRISAAAERIGHGTVPIVQDVSTAAGGARFAKQAAEALGGSLDILVANCGGPPSGDFEQTDVSAYLPAIEQNMLSSIAMCKEAIPPMRQQEWGRVIAITSLAVRQPQPHLVLSNTARTGLTGFLKTVAREIAADGVTVNSVLPGGVATDRIDALYGGPSGLVHKIPAGRLGKPDDFGAIVAFLCSEQAAHITGSALAVDGGGDAALV